MPRNISTSPAVLGKVSAMFSIRIKAPRPLLLLRPYGLAAVLCNLLAIPAFAAEPVTIIALGDSLTAGYGLPEQDGFVPQLDQWLAEQGRDDVEIVNMGVSGDTTAGGLSRLDWAFAEGGDAAIVALGGNDMLRGIDPAVSRENLESILQDLDERNVPVLLAGMIAPANFGPGYKEAFDAMYPALAEEHSALLYPFFLDGVVGAEGLFQDDNLHPNKDGVRVMVEGIGPKVLELIERIETAAANGTTAQ